MNKEQLITHEVGSLAKPEWRVKAISGQKIQQREIEEARTWGNRLEIDSNPLLDILRDTVSSGEKLNPEQRRNVRHWASVYAIRLQERAGLDVVYDGEQNRTEMYEHSVRRSEGFEHRGLVRAFDNKYFNKFACTGEPKVKTPWHTDELLEIQKIAEKDIKIPITGPYTIAAWSYDEYYNQKANQELKEELQIEGDTRRDFILGITRNLVRPNVEELLEKGAKWIQIDEPAATTIPSEIPLVVESFNELTRGLAKPDHQFSIHICFSDYSLLFPHITNMENCDQYSLEFANRDSRNLGTNDADRPAYEVLKLFKEYGINSRIGLGVTDVHSDFIEPPELVRDRILYAANTLGDPNLINPSPDCGLRTRSWDASYEKLTSVVHGSRLAEETLQK